MKKYIIANWKMNLSIHEAIDFCKQLTVSNFDYKKILIAPPNIYLSQLSNYFKNITFIAQDLSAIKYDYGAFTGEVSAKMLKDMKINYSIVGHSERVINCGEDFTQTKNKILNCLRNNLVPIICFGETLAEQSSNNFIIAIEAKIAPVLDVLLNYNKDLSTNELAIILSYEPLWAVGCNINLDISKLEQTFQLISNVLNRFYKVYQAKYKQNIENKIKLVYGGSVRLENTQLLLAVPEIDGLLIGNSSLEVSKFIKICHVANAHN